MKLPLHRELAWREPFEAFLAFADRRRPLFLDSAQQHPRLGRYSFIAFDPFHTLDFDGFVSRLDGRPTAEDPFELLETLLARFPQRSIEGLPPFQGGAAGYFGYDLCHRLERIPAPASGQREMPDMALGFYGLVLAFDHVQQRAWMIDSGAPAHGDEGRALAQDRMNEAAAVLSRSVPGGPERSRFAAPESTKTSLSKPTAAPSSGLDASVNPGPIADLDSSANPDTDPDPDPESSPSSEPVRIRSNFSRPEYEAAVQRVIDYILAGDIFQANLSRRLDATLSAGDTPLDLYTRLRRDNPAPFAAYLDYGAGIVASASPERFLRLRPDGWVETRPIKGTRPRGDDSEADLRLAQELLASEKDRAENVMIVDLLRNDLSRVCRDYSVTTPEICELESYATVHHLVSSVLGRLREDQGAVDLLEAAFPGGSITGAPKVRAMEIIAELEPTRRGLYCGSVGYLGFDGAMDTSIVIRTFHLRPAPGSSGAAWTASFQAGGGIVADSDPAAEYQETVDKAAALVRALRAEPEA